MGIAGDAQGARCGGKTGALFTQYAQSIISWVDARKMITLTQYIGIIFNAHVVTMEHWKELYGDESNDRNKPQRQILR